MEYAPSGLPTGLRYEGCMAVLRANRAALGIPAADMGRWFGELQIVERAIVAAVAEVNERKRADERTG